MRAVTGSYPARGADADLITTLCQKPDLSRLRKCYATWYARGYNPRVGPGPLGQATMILCLRRGPPIEGGQAEVFL